MARVTCTLSIHLMWDHPSYQWSFLLMGEKFCAGTRQTNWLGTTWRLKQSAWLWRMLIKGQSTQSAMHPKTPIWSTQGVKIAWSKYGTKESCRRMWGPLLVILRESLTYAQRETGGTWPQMGRTSLWRYGIWGKWWTLRSLVRWAYPLKQGMTIPWRPFPWLIGSTSMLRTNLCWHLKVTRCIIPSSSARSVLEPAPVGDTFSLAQPTVVCTSLTR